LKGIDAEISRAFSTRKLTILEVELLSQVLKDKAFISDDYLEMVLNKWEYITQDIRQSKLKKRRFQWLKIRRRNQ
jgi:hypothetical protein